MTSLQSNYFDIDAHQFSPEFINHPLLSQLLEMEDLKSSLALPAGSQIVDFGCGSGRLSLFFLSQGYGIFAVDISRKSLHNLQNIYYRLRKTGWGNLTVSQNLPHTPFDGLIGSDILHHVDIRAVLPQLHSFLKPGGKIAFSEPNALNIFWYIYYLIKQIPWTVESGITQNTLINLRRLLKDNLFTDIQIKGHGLFPTRIFNFSRPLCQFNCLKLGQVFFLRPFSYRFIISAQK